MEDILSQIRILNKEIINKTEKMISSTKKNIIIEEINKAVYDKKKLYCQLDISEVQITNCTTTIFNEEIENINNILESNDINYYFTSTPINIKDLIYLQFIENYDCYEDYCNPTRSYIYAYSKKNKVK
jgi:hypothetical protein